MQIDKFFVQTFPGIDTVGLASDPHPLRVCIATEEILGPVRNGGIASTYYHLAKGLAARGHEVHVLFLKGSGVENKTPEHWIEHFASFGVTLHYLTVPDRPMLAASTQWQRRFWGAYLWLKEQPAFDVVHTSEWRGGMLYALMAKRLGLAFQETLFIVKTSSPYIWNRHYQMLPIEKRDLLAAAHAEQKCVELADMVVGGSAHLITFMKEIGYRVPTTNVFVQPNIMDFSEIHVTDGRPPRAAGDRVHSDELTFFGRLEGRKGIELFCNALDILLQRGVTPKKVNFLGKFGQPLASRGGMKIRDYLEAKVENWPFPVEYITELNQPEALSFMCQRDMFAVMPSLIENSTMAVYEALEFRIPFVATQVGGTAELIHPDDRGSSLIAPKSQALADRLEEILKNGQVIARPSFSNDENLDVWYGFHNFIGKTIAEDGRAKAIAGFTASLDRAAPGLDTIAFVALIRDGETVDPLVSALLADQPDEVVLTFTDFPIKPVLEKAAETLKAAGIAAQITDALGQTAGDAINQAVGAARSAALVVSTEPGVIPRPGFFAAAKTALQRQPECLFTSFFLGPNDMVGMPLGGDVASQFLSPRAYGPELIAMTRSRYDSAGPFEPYDVGYGTVHEYVTRIVQRGDGDLLVLAEELLEWPDAPRRVETVAKDLLGAYLKAKPLVDAGSLSMRKTLLATMLATDSSQMFGRKSEELAGRLERSKEKSAAILSRLTTPGEPDIRGALTARRKSWGHGDWLSGWAWDRNDRDRNLNILVTMNGKPVFATCANELTPPLGRRTPGLELHGFSVPVLPEMLDSSTPVRLVIQESGQTVKNGHFVSVATEDGQLRLTIDWETVAG